MKEDERSYYNRRLLDKEVKNELKKSKIDWKDLIVRVIGVWIGLMLSDAVQLENLISNSVVGFCAEVLIVTAALLLVAGAVHMIENHFKKVK